VSAFYNTVADRAEHRCEYCHAPEIVFNIAFEVEHIIPESRQGTNALHNFALACRSFNQFKSNTQQAWDEVSGVVASQFHPRRDIWDEHFQIDSNTAEIIGLTPTGRVTATCLQMNRPKQITARHHWVLLELFP
jgi:hypothetical protein